MESSAVINVNNSVIKSSDEVLRWSYMVIVPSLACPNEAHKVGISWRDAPENEFIDHSPWIKNSKTSRVERTMTPDVADWVDRPDDMQADQIAENISVPDDNECFAQIAS